MSMPHTTYVHCAPCHSPTALNVMKMAILRGTPARESGSKT